MRESLCLILHCCLYLTLHCCLYLMLHCCLCLTLHCCLYLTLHCCLYLMLHCCLYLTLHCCLYLVLHCCLYLMLHCCLYLMLPLSNTSFLLMGRNGNNFWSCCPLVTIVTCSWTEAESNPLNRCDISTLSSTVNVTLPPWTEMENRTFCIYLISQKFFNHLACFIHGICVGGKQLETDIIHGRYCDTCQHVTKQMNEQFITCKQSSEAVWKSRWPSGLLSLLSLQFLWM